MPLVTILTLEKFANRFTVGDDGCWMWNGYMRSKTSNRGAFFHNYKQHSAYKFLYEALFGKIPAGMTLDHLCKEPRCVNPTHLEVVSRRENVQRYNRSITHCKYGHEFDVPEWAAKTGRRYCNTCHAKREAARRERKREELQLCL